MASVTAEAPRARSRIATRPMWAIVWLQLRAMWDSAMALRFRGGLCATLGVVTGRDLARACRDRYPRPVVLGLWASAEIAIAMRL